MNGALKVLAAASVLAASVSLAGAMPAMKPGDLAQAAGSTALKVHGFHEYCARDRFGWHRHNAWGERRRCRTWRGVGPRPDFCVRVGPLWVCDY